MNSIHVLSIIENVKGFPPLTNDQYSWMLTNGMEMIVKAEVITLSGERQILNIRDVKPLSKLHEIRDGEQLESNMVLWEGFVRATNTMRVGKRVQGVCHIDYIPPHWVEVTL